MKLLSLKADEIISFNAFDSTPGGNNLGRAEFQFCPIWKYTRIRELFIYPRQQRDMPDGWHLTDLRSIDFGIHSWIHKGIDRPEPWLYGYCKEHRCMTIRVYVPANANCFSMQVLTSLGVYFDAK